MTIKTNQTNQSQNEPIERVVRQDHAGTELYDSPTPDSYDQHIIPAETAARKEREGDNFKHLAEHPAGSDSIDTTGGFTVDKEGLMDNFAIEPQMYYHIHGDLPDKVRQQPEVAEHLSEIRQDQINQEEIHQDQINQEEIHQDQINQEKIHQDQINQEKIRQDQINQEKIRQDQINQEKIRQDQINQEKIRQDQINQEKIRQDQINQEKIRQDQINQEKIRQDQINQEKIRQDQINQEKIHQDQINQEKIHQDQINQEKIRQDQINQEKIHQDQINQESKQLAVGTFSSYEVTEIALGELKTSGFLMDRVSVVGRDINSHTEVTGVHTSNRLTDTPNLLTDENQAEGTAKDGAIAGGAIGGFTGLLVGLGLMAIPGVGPVMLAGAAATAIATAISGGVIGAAAGSLVGGLVGLGIPADRAKVYSDRVFDGDYLVMVEGSEAVIAQAKSIFSNHGIRNWYVYEPMKLSDELS